MPENVPYVWWRGVKEDHNSIPSLVQAEKLSGITIDPTQGGYNKGGVAQSGGTHDGGAVIDVSVKYSNGTMWSSTRRALLVKWMRRCGWAAWVRSPSQGDWPWHIHGVRIGDGSASWAAEQQVKDYLAGRNGLANHHADDGPKVFHTTWEASPYNPANQKPGRVRMKVVRGPLWGLDANRNQKVLRQVGWEVAGIRVRRWGRWNLMTNYETFYAIAVGETRYLDYVKK